eukprot:1428389-Pleurochrysis_carterae.AAC.1
MGAASEDSACAASPWPLQHFDHGFCILCMMTCCCCFFITCFASCGAAEVREKMHGLLQQYGLAIDLRTKEEGRQTQEKFYEGGEWQKFCCGGGDSPGGP